MKTVYSDDHKLHSGLLDPRGNHWRDSAECPARANNVIQAIRGADLGDVIEPKPFADSLIEQLHAPDYLAFLKTVWAEWAASDEEGANARPDTFVGAGMRHADTASIVGKLGRYSFDATTPFVAGTWQAARTSANVALTAADLVRGKERFAFAACRPPGHHATRNYCGGYCYLNNNSLAAQSLLNAGASRVAILDVDYHHGNGTQSIFYRRSDVLTVSIHADPVRFYPFFWGAANERGSGDGRGCNVNLPLPRGTGDEGYLDALDSAVAKIESFDPGALVVALGLDAFGGDPFAGFAVTTAGFARIAERIRALGLPTVLVQEGGYLCPALGDNLAAFLGPFSQ